MKVFLRYEDNEDESVHKTLKITLPKSWKAGPNSRLLDQFVESYNAVKETPLDATALHLAVRRPDTSNGNNGDSVDDTATVLAELASDGIVIETISDREDVYVCHGLSRTTADIETERTALLEKERAERESLSKCIHFGCNLRFPKGGPYPPACKYHSGPPVFHETAKFWSCCPNKKAYDWDEFQALPACQTGTCTDVEETEGGDARKEFLGGCDLREKLSGPKLRSIDDFNSSVAAGGSDGAPVLERLRLVLEELGVENELFDQVVEGMKREITEQSGPGVDDAVLVDEAVKVMGAKIKSVMKSIAAEQQRIK